MLFNHVPRNIEAIQLFFLLFYVLRSLESTISETSHEDFYLPTLIELRSPRPYPHGCNIPVNAGTLLFKFCYSQNVASQYTSSDGESRLGRLAKLINYRQRLVIFQPSGRFCITLHTICNLDDYKCPSFGQPVEFSTNYASDPSTLGQTNVSGICGLLKFLS